MGPSINTQGRDLGDDFYYDEGTLPLLPYLTTELPRKCVALHGTLGIDTLKRSNALLINKDTILTSVGNVVLIIDIASKSIRYIFGRNGRGIGALSVHPSGVFFAVADQGNKPTIWVYQYPSLKIYRKLDGGADFSFLALAFNQEGNKLASVGGYPDFLLTVWEWRREAIILRNKAFSQTIFNVSFLFNDDGFLTTSGMGHIRFWKMADTFTGLKLQGELGKFGKVELTDISAYAELPDNKVLSGSESGSLLLWEGKFIKLEIRRPGGALPHEGEIHAICLVNEDTQTQDGQFITAADDECLRWWSLNAIDCAEISENNSLFELAPTREMNIPEVCVRSLIRSPDCTFFILQDYHGAFWRLNEPVTPVSKLELVLSSHAGAVTGLGTSPIDHFAATAGADGSVRCWDYIEKKQLFLRHFPLSATVLTWAPISVDSSARTVAVGFQDGIVRVLLRCRTEWKRIAVFKPHSTSVLAIKYSPDGKRVATVGADGVVFILDLIHLGHDADATTYEPFGFVAKSTKVDGGGGHVALRGTPMDNAF